MRDCGAVVVPSDGAPYPVLVFAAMLPWQFFANALTECSGSLITNANLVSKIYFPRVIVPTSAVVVISALRSPQVSHRFSTEIYTG